MGPFQTSRGLQLLFQDTDNFISKSVRDTGVWEERVAECIETYANPEYTFLDIGAHVGYFSLLAALYYKRVIAVEADPSTVDILRNNVTLNKLDEIIEVHQVAISDIAGPSHLSLDNKDGNNPGASYLGKEGTPVYAVKLSTLLGDIRPDVIKIDIEGLEARVLEDAGSILDSVKVLIIEASPEQYKRYGSNIEDMITYLNNTGFTVTDVSGEPYKTLKGWDYTNLLARRSLAIAEWEELNPTTPEEIARFYKTTNNYKADLDAWHRQQERQFVSQILVGAAKASNAKRILDIGCGVGQDIQALLNSGEDLLIEGIEPNDYMRKLVGNTGIIVWNSFDELENNAPTLEFDMITCIDVLEHVYDPEKEILEPMLRNLKMGGVFIEVTSTNDTKTPLHLKRLRGWSPARFLDKNGFILQENLTENKCRVWRRVYEARDDAPNLLLCAYRGFSAETASSLFGCIENGWRHHIQSGDALVSRVRSTAVSKWYQEDGGEVFLMVDDDIVFDPKDASKVVELAREKKSIASGAYPVRNGGHFASRLFQTERVVTFGPDLEPVEIEWAGTGFIAVHRDVITAMIEQCADVNLCLMSDQFWFWPFFQPFQWFNKANGYYEYLSEDWAFCERAKQLGFKIWLDPTVILDHIAQTRYNVFNMTNFVPIPSDAVMTEGVL